MRCGESVELTEMRSHIARCNELSSDDDFEPVTVRFRVPGSERGESSASRAQMPSINQSEETHRSRSPITVRSDSVSETDPKYKSKMGVLCDMFPKFSLAQVETVWDLVNKKVDRVCTVLLNLNSQVLLRVLRAVKMSTRIAQITINPNNILADELRVYKHTDFDPSIPIEVSFVRQPAIDLGGVRRQFFSSFIKELATQLHLFEGEYEQGRLLPSRNHEAIISGTFKMFGKVIVHSVLMEGPGFPCFPPAVYRYITGANMEQLLPYLCTEYLTADIRHVIDKVRYCNTFINFA